MRVSSVLKPINYLNKQNKGAHDIQELYRPSVHMDTMMFCIFPFPAPPVVILIPQFLTAHLFQL